MNKIAEIDKEGDYLFTMGNSKGIIEYRNNIIIIYEIINEVK